MVTVELSVNPGYKYLAVRVSGRHQRMEDNAQLHEHVLQMLRHLCLLRFPLKPVICFFISGEQRMKRISIPESTFEVNYFYIMYLYVLYVFIFIYLKRISLIVYFIF